MLHQLNMLVGEWPNLAAIDVESANYLIFLEHWHDDQRTDTSKLQAGHRQRVAFEIGAILLEIDYVDRLTSSKNTRRWHRRTRPKQCTDAPFITPRLW